MTTSKEEALNPPIDNMDINDDGDDKSGCDSDDSWDDDFVTIYPGCQRLRYPAQDLVDFSTRAITKYNHKKGYTYTFVELVEGLLHVSFVADNVLTTFKARQGGDGEIMTFRAETYSASRTVSDPNIHIKVALLLPDSDGCQRFYSSDSEVSDESECESEEYEFDAAGMFHRIDKADKLKTQVELLKVSS